MCVYENSFLSSNLKKHSEHLANVSFTLFKIRSCLKKVYLTLTFPLDNNKLGNGGVVVVGFKNSLKKDLKHLCIQVSTKLGKKCNHRKESEKKKNVYLNIILVKQVDFNGRI